MVPNAAGYQYHQYQAYRQVADEVPAPTYATSYGEEIARKLGVRDGHIDLMTVRTAEGDDFGLVLSKGVYGNTATIGLQWRPEP